MYKSSGGSGCYPTKEVLDAVNQILPKLDELGSYFLGTDEYDKTWNEIINIMKSAGFSYLGFGVTRHVFGFKNNGHECVIKIANNSDTRYANMMEVATWYSVPEDMRKFFVPIDAAEEKGWWITEPKVEMADERERFEALEDLRDGLLDHGWECLDLHEDNVDYYQGRPVILNYGFGLKCKKAKRGRGS